MATISVENLRRVFRLIFGGGADIDVANPLPVTSVPGSPPYSALCLAATIPAGTIYYVPSGEAWGVLALTVEGILRIDGEVHAWDDVNGGGVITGEGELRLH